MNILHAPSLVEQVNEGVHGTRPPLATLQDAWAATFLLYFATSESAEWGSAFVIRNDRRGARRTLDLVTADHVLRKYCTARRCANASVFVDGHIKMNPSTGDQEHVSIPLVSPNLQVLARDEATDLALIRITVDAGVSPAPVRIARDDSRNGDRVWTVGYPNVFLRETKAGIDSANHMIRRWSEGQTMGAVRVSGGMADFDSTARVYKGQTVDSLPGNSGGAVLNDQGEVLGVLAQAGASETPGHVYVKRFGAEKIPSVAVSLAALKEFLAKFYDSNRSRQMSAAN